MALTDEQLMLLEQMAYLDPDLCSLKLTHSDEENRNYCFVDPKEPDKGIVVLRGTWGGLIKNYSLDTD